METSIIEELYDLLSKEFLSLQNTSYPIHKLAGYEDALWDLKVVAEKKFQIDLPKVEKHNADNDACICGHIRKEHLASGSINWTNGRCTKCTCKNFSMNTQKQLTQ